MSWLGKLKKRKSLNTTKSVTGYHKNKGARSKAGGNGNAVSIQIEAIAELLYGIIRHNARADPIISRPRSNIKRGSDT